MFFVSLHCQDHSLCPYNPIYYIIDFSCSGLWSHFLSHLSLGGYLDMIPTYDLFFVSSHCYDYSLCASSPIYYIIDLSFSNLMSRLQICELAPIFWCVFVFCCWFSQPFLLIMYPSSINTHLRFVLCVYLSF